MLKKFDWRPCSNISKANKLSKRVIRPRVLKINLQPLAVKGVNKEQKPCSLFFKRVWRTHSLIPGDVPILLKGHQSNFVSKFLWKKPAIRFQIYFRGKFQFFAKVEVLFIHFFHYSTRFHCNFYDKSNYKYVLNIKVRYEIMILHFVLTWPPADIGTSAVVRVIEQWCFNSVPDPFNGQTVNFILKPPKVIESRTYVKKANLKHYWNNTVLLIWQQH